MAKRKEYHMWTRVFGPNLDPGNKERMKKNIAVQESKVFIDACKKENIEPTRRQASKFRRKKGLAYNGNQMPKMQKRS